MTDARPEGMSHRLLLTALALAVLLLALGGWLVQALRWPANAMAVPAR